MSCYGPLVSSGAQLTATTTTYFYGAYQPHYYQWPPYSYAVPQQTPSRSAQSVTQTATVPTATTISTTSTTPKPSIYTPYTSYTSATSTSTAGRSSRKQSSTKGLNLMYGFGDDRNPANDTINVMEKILVEYIADVCQAAAEPGCKNRLSIEDLRKALSQLLFAQEDIRRAKQQFKTDPKMA
ncbi:hypothetical protein F5877DRAFT_89528 [Lentinula edodes]|nr:hypothetical protein F5877DRAFT_89528 [Lentinula edodes]